MSKMYIMETLGYFLSLSNSGSILTLTLKIKGSVVTKAQLFMLWYGRHDTRHNDFQHNDIHHINK